MPFCFFVLAGRLLVAAVAVGLLGFALLVGFVVLVGSFAGRLVLPLARLAGLLVGARLRLVVAFALGGRLFFFGRRLRAVFGRILFFAMLQDFVDRIAIVGAVVGNRLVIGGRVGAALVAAPTALGAGAAVGTIAVAAGLVLLLIAG